jgi:hypothetical protein
MLRRETKIVNRDTLRELAVFGLLLAIGVLGRWAQPDWNFTPIAAVTVLGGFYFRRLLPAVLLPLSILAISDLLLVPHDSWPVLVTVHAMMIVPLFLGRSARGASGRQAAWRWGLCGVVPATAFFVVTNLAVWAFTGLYAKTFAGLTACYVAAVPFYRTMLAGDLFYLAVLLGCLAIARATSKTPVVAPAKVR